MASVRGNLLRNQLKAMKPILKRIDTDIETARKAQDTLGDLGASALKEDVSFKMERFDKFEADWALPTDEIEGNRAVLYLHGGSYTAGTLRYARGFGGILANTLRVKVLCVGYRLAPEHPFPAALEDALEAYRRLLETHASNELALIGESAGGGLCFALLLKLKLENLPLPSCVVTLSPWTDLTLSNPAVIENAEADPSLFGDALRYSAVCYGEDDLTNPLISPQFGDVTGLPPALVLCGADELLRDDGVTMVKKIKDSGGRAYITVADGMWHVYPLYGLPESEDALSEIKTFVADNIK